MTRTIILNGLRAIAAAFFALAMGARAEQPYAITTLTADDLARSGATHLPDALRLTPGLDVARINANTWAISARGFNGQFANKLDVTIDGRSVYSPLFGGVYWSEIDLPLDDIDRVEIVHGPTSGGGMNGTIRIYTKHSRDTAGGRVSAWAGPGDGVGTQFRYGWLPNDRLGLRLSLAHGDHQSFDAPNGGEAFDAWNDGRAGLRLDWIPDDENTLTLSGSAFDIHMRNEVPKTVSQLLRVPGRQKLYGQFAASRSTSHGGGGTLTWQHRLDDANLLVFRANAEHIARHSDSFDDDSARYGASIEYQTQPGAHQLRVGA
ncbi:MAG: TonB-dependent receptor plug domain-containing protein, partial [Candidatus Hydrogenedentota bacterium]